MNLKQIMVISVDVKEVLSVGKSPVGEVRVIPFDGGTFEGDGMAGRLLPGGTDWQRVRDDGGLEIRAHYMLESDRGERIEVISDGIRVHLPESDSGTGEVYFRTSIRLNASAPRLAHVNDRIYVGRGKRLEQRVEITVFEVP